MTLFSTMSQRANASTLRILPKYVCHGPSIVTPRLFSTFRHRVKPTIRPTVHISSAHIGSYQACWQLQTMILRSNVDRWIENMKGEYYKLQYIDTCAKFPKDVQNAFPAVLALPGSPGNHKELMSLMEPLVKRGVRVIMLNFPHFDYCSHLYDFSGKLKPSMVGAEMFTNTTAERTEFVMRVLDQLEVPSIELGVAQGAGAVPLLLYLNASSNMKAGMFICPYPVHQPIALAKPLWFTKNLPQLHAQGIPKIFRWIMSTLLCKARGFKCADSNERYNAIQVAVNIGFNGMPDYAKNLSEMDCPLSYVFTTKDPKIRHSVSRASAKLMGIEDENIWRVKPNDAWTSEGISDRNKRALEFNVASHHPQEHPLVRKLLVEEMLYLITAGNRVYEEIMKKQYAHIDDACIDVYNKENRKHANPESHQEYQVN